jgi:hypothetical protein
VKKTKQVAEPVTEPSPPRGLDAARHAKHQRVAAQADVIRTGVLASHMAAALGMGGQIGTDAFRVYLARLKHDLGNPADPVLEILIEQLAFAHLRLARLHGQAAEAKGTETVKVTNAACSRLMGEVRRTALTISALRSTAPAAPRLKIAQTG